MDEGQPIAGPSGSRYEFAEESDRASESEQESSSSGDRSDDNGSEDEQEQNRLQPAENEIEGDFECVYFFVNRIDSEGGSTFHLA